MNNPEQAALPDVQIHEIVRNYFRTIGIEALFTIQAEQFFKQRDRRFMGRRSYNKLLAAQAKRKRSGKTPYFPENIKL